LPILHISNSVLWNLPELMRQDNLRHFSRSHLTASLRGWFECCDTISSRGRENCHLRKL